MISYVGYRIGVLRTIRGLRGLFGRKVDTSGAMELLHAYIDEEVDPHPNDRGHSWVAPTQAPSGS